jgi:signal transduction histidine kinase
MIALADDQASASTRLDLAAVPRRLARGTGLGLSIVHRIVSDYGGELLMTSARGKGTTVTGETAGGGGRRGR